MNRTRTSKLERRSSNVEARTAKLERRSSNVEPNLNTNREERT